MAPEVRSRAAEHADPPQPGSDERGEHRKLVPPRNPGPFCLLEGIGHARVVELLEEPPRPAAGQEGRVEALPDQALCLRRQIWREELPRDRMDALTNGPL